MLKKLSTVILCSSALLVDAFYLLKFDNIINIKTMRRTMSMKYKTTVAALLFALAGANAMASSVHVQIAQSQHFNQFVNKAQSKDNIEIELQVQNLNHEDDEVGAVIF